MLSPRRACGTVAARVNATRWACDRLCHDGGKRAQVSPPAESFQKARSRLSGKRGNEGSARRSSPRAATPTQATSRLRRSPAAIAKAALEEDVDVVGLSILSGAYLPLCQKVKEELDAQGAGEAILLVGGNIPARDHEALQALGVHGIFPTATPFEKIVDFVRERAQPTAG